MGRHPDRRAFLRGVSAAVVAPTVAAWGCTLERQPGDDDVPLGPPRPILIPWGPDAVRVQAPPRERPVAYLSHRAMQVWVDLEYRDRLQYAFGAHISVSTAHWRIPLPGDPANIPIQAGDQRREFVEVDMREWDAGIEPAEGDVRILRGSPIRAEMRIECQPLSGGGRWFSAQPIELLQCGPPDERICREDLMEVGTATRFQDRDCARADGTVRVVTWACRESTLPEGA